MSCEGSLHEIVQGLTVARCQAEILADTLEGVDADRAASARRFSEELGRLWRAYLPLLRGEHQP